MHPDVDELKQRLATRVRQLTDARPLSGAEFERRTRHSRNNIRWLRNADRLPARHVIEALDRELGTGTELTDLGERIRAAQQAQKLRELTEHAGTGTVGKDSDTSTVEAEGVGSTNRREFTTFAALAALASSTRQAIETGSTSERTLDDLESDVDEIAWLYGSAPHAALLGEVAGRWRQVESILARRMTADTRARVTLLGGQLTYFLGHLAFNASDFRSARQFAGLAGTYAAEATEPVLVMSVATLHSSIAYHTQRYRKAVAALRPVQALHHPYMDARIAAYEARALAKAGDHTGARRALDRMEATACSMAPMPGETPVGPAAVAMFRSGVAVIMGDGEMAREWAPIALDGYRAQGGDFTVEEYQHAAVNEAMTHLTGREAEPEETARIASDLLANSSEALTHTVTTRLRQCANVFTPAQRKLPAVAAFRDECRALPTGSTRR